MASPTFEGGKRYSTGDVLAHQYHDEKEERLRHGHSNENIDPGLTPLNFCIKNRSLAERRNWKYR